MDEKRIVKKTNVFYNDLSDIFNTEEFKKFKIKYFTNELDKETSILFISLMIHFHKEFPEEHDNEKFIQWIHLMVSNSNVRHKLITNPQKRSCSRLL